MDAICRCFKEPDSPTNPDNDGEETEKWALITESIQNEKQLKRSMRNRANDADDEKVKEYSENDNDEAFKMQSDYENEDNDEDDDDDDESEISDGISSIPSLTSDTSKQYEKYALNDIKTKYDPLYEDTPSTFTSNRIISSVTTSNDSITWDDHTPALGQDDSMLSTTMTQYNECANCMNTEHIQKQLEIQIQTVRDRNNELEDKIVDAQTNEENTKRLYDELKEDFDRIQHKYDVLLKSSEENKVKYDLMLQQTRNKLEDEIQNTEKNYQDIVREKNTLELNLNETHDKLEKTESDLMNAQNLYSTLNVQKARVEEDLKTEQSKIESLNEEYKEKMNIFEKDRNDLMETIKKEKQKALTEKENNELTTNLLKDQIRSLHSEIADIEEEKKALQESISLYDKQMKAEQLMDNTSLDLILEDDEDDDDDDDDDNAIIPEDQETELFINGTIVYDPFRKRHSKSNNMSISELEPATFSRLPFNNDPSENDDDAVYINYETDPNNKKTPNNNKNLLNLSAINSSPLLFPNLSPIVRALTPPHYDLDEMEENKLNTPKISEEAEDITPIPTHSKNLLISTRGARSASDVLRQQKSPTKSKHGYSTSATFQQINVWKDRYSELKSESTMNAKQMAQKDIELDSFRDKIKSLQNEIAEYINELERVQNDLNSLRSSYVDLHSNESLLRKEHQVELDSIRRSLNNARDEIVTLSTENTRYLEYKDKMVKEYKKKDKLHTKQLKFNEELMNEIFDLNNEVKQLTDVNIEMKSALESVIVSSGESGDKYDIVKRKLSKAEKERKEEQKQNKRLKNKVSSLNKEVLSLNQTISNLESLFLEHSNVLQSKNKRIKHLGKQREEQQQSIHRLSSKLKKRDRHIKGFLAAEEHSFKKAHSAKDKRLNMLRETNMKLVVKIEESDKKLLEIKSSFRDLKSKLKEERENRRIDNGALQVEISKLTAQNNQIVTQKQEIEYERDNTIRMNCELMEQIKSNNIEIANAIHVNRDAIEWLNSMDIKDDTLYKFVCRCRNTFINTNKLTNKLITQLIEGCDRAIAVYYNSLSYFKLFIDSCLGIKDRFKNIEKSYTSLEFHSYELYQSALCSIYNIGGSSSAASNVTGTKRESININTLRSTRKILNPKNKDVIPKIPLIAKDLIRKPIQSETVKVPIEAYNQIYHLLSKYIQNALNDLRNVTVIYSSPLNLSIYNEHQMDDKKEISFDDEVHINWNTLSIDPSTERLYPGLKESNDKRFDQIMNEINNSSKEFRKEQTKKLMQLDGAWHQYNITVTNTNNDNLYLSPLTLKVSSQGIHNKRYSIV